MLDLTFVYTTPLVRCQFCPGCPEHPHTVRLTPSDRSLCGSSTETLFSGALCKIVYYVYHFPAWDFPFLDTASLVPQLDKADEQLTLKCCCPSRSPCVCRAAPKREWQHWAIAQHLHYSTYSLSMALGVYDETCNRKL